MRHVNAIAGYLTKRVKSEWEKLQILSKPPLTILRIFPQSIPYRYPRLNIFLSTLEITIFFYRQTISIKTEEINRENKSNCLQFHYKTFDQRVDVFQAARIYIKSPDVCLFNIPSDRICRSWRGCKMCHAYRDGGTIEKARTSAQFKGCRARAREKFNRKETSWAYIYVQHIDTRIYTRILHLLASLFLSRVCLLKVPWKAAR